MNSESVGCSMWSLSSIPTNAAWSILKQDDLSSLPPELQDSMQSFYEDLPDEQREKVEMISQALQQMPSETQEKIKQLLIATIQHNADNLPDILNQADPEYIFTPEQSERGTFKLSLFGLGHELAHADESVRKLLPVAAWYAGAAIATVFAADGVNRSQGAKESAVGLGLKEIGAGLGINDPPPEGSWAGVTEYDDKAVFMEPFLGTEVTEAQNPTFWQRAGAGVLGAMQGLTGGQVFARGARAGLAGARAGRQSRIAVKEAGKEVAEGTSERAARIANANRVAAESKAKALRAKQTDLHRTTGIGRRATDAGRRAVQGINSVFQTKLGDLAPALAPSTGGAGAGMHGTASATPSAGGAGAGIAGVGNRASRGMGDKEIWRDKGTTEWSGQYGQTQKGEIMTLGDELIKEAKDKMNGKKGSKKPAHGMVIVIGTNAGPGPSKDGKRVKKD